MNTEERSTPTDSGAKPAGYFRKAKGIANCYQYMDSNGKPGAFYFRGNIEGREVRKRLQNKDRTVLQREILALTQRLKNQAEGKLIPKRFGEFLDQYVEVLRADVAPKTLENVVWLQKELRKSFSQINFDLDQITTGQLRAWLDDLILQKTGIDPKTGQQICRFGNRSRNIFRNNLIKFLKTAGEITFAPAEFDDALPGHLSKIPRAVSQRPSSATKHAAIVLHNKR